MKIVCVYGHMFNVHTWSMACQGLAAEGIDLVLFSQARSADKLAVYMETHGADLFIGQLFKELPNYDLVLDWAQRASSRAALGWDMPSEFSTFTQEEMTTFNTYLKSPHTGNYQNGVRYLAALGGAKVTAAPVIPVKSCGIYHPDSQGLFLQGGGGHPGAGRGPGHL